RTTVSTTVSKKPKQETVKVDRESVIVSSIEEVKTVIQDGSYEVLIIRLTDDERNRLIESVKETDFFGWVNKLYNEDHQINIGKITTDQLMGNTEWPYKKSEYVKFPNAESGMLNLYWSNVHETVYSLETIKEICKVYTGTDKWKIKHNRFRLAQPGTGGSESIHTDHSGLDIDRKPRPAVVLSLSEGRTFTYYTGTGSRDFMSRIRTQYGDKLSSTKNYVTYDITYETDPLGILSLKRVVEMKAGDILIFNDNILHEVSKNTSHYCQLSLFLSPYNPETQPFIGKPISELSDAARVTTGVCHYYDENLSISDAQICSFLLGISPSHWPSGKPTFTFNTQAVAAYRKKLTPCAISSYNQLPYEPLPVCSIRVTEELLQRCDTRNIFIPEVMRKFTHWYRDPTLLTDDMLYRLNMITVTVN
ncbi:MAG: hypothetical protein EBU66_20340, partial [Bacteroidetes bacterium]|nr:hypothetical protein [Bacteroidota bacterium]